MSAILSLWGFLWLENALQWRHNERNGVSNHRRPDCLLNRLFGCRSKKTSKLGVTSLCEGNQPVTGGFPTQRASNAENVSIWLRHCVMQCRRNGIGPWGIRNNYWTKGITTEMPFDHNCGNVFMCSTDYLTHWGRVTHIYVGKLTIIGSDNGLSPGRRQAIIWTNAGILLIRPIGTNFSEILSEIHSFSFKKMHLKMSSAKWRPFCFGLINIEVLHRTSHVAMPAFPHSEKSFSSILQIFSN